MLKRIVAVIAGLVTGFLVVTFGDLIIHQFIEVPKGLDVMNKKAMAEFVAQIPLSYLVMMVGYWLLSSFLGAMVAAAINRNGWRNSSLIVGAILMIGAISNMLMIPHPQWMLIATLVGYIPIAWLGGKLISMVFKQKS